MSTDLTKWPFPDPPETLALTNRIGIEKNLMCFNIVRHVDLPGEAAWQFLFAGGKPSAKGRMQLPLSEIVKFDPSVKEVADLPIGWRAYRVRRMGEWRREELNPPGWPFKDPRDADAFTSKEILARRAEVAMVTHEAESEWCFYPAEGRIRDEDRTLESLEAIYRVDTSIAALGDMPIGWEATRKSLSDPWVRGQFAADQEAQNEVHGTSQTRAAPPSLPISAPPELLKPPVLSCSPRREPTPFDDPEHSEVLASRDVIQSGARIVVVAHHDSGSWGFYSDRGGRGLEDVGSVVFDELIERDPDISRMRFLKKGETAIRVGEGMHERWILPDEEKSKRQPQMRSANDPEVRFRRRVVWASSIGAGLLGFLIYYIPFVQRHAAAFFGYWTGLSAWFGVTGTVAKSGYEDAGGKLPGVKRGCGWGVGTLVGLSIAFLILRYFPHLALTSVWAMNGVWLAYFLAGPVQKALLAGNTRMVRVLVGGAAAFLLILFLLDLLAANTHS